MNILGISGSLRKGSYNTLLLRAATERAGAFGGQVTNADISAVPLYNQDLDGDEKPAAVTALIAAIDKAEGLLLASPEYNYSVPGVLKNALDWASRPAYKSVLVGKPALIITASISTTGGARAHAHLRDVLASTLTPVYPAPEYLLAEAQNAFDDSGKLTDDRAISRLDRHLEGYLDWAKHIGKKS